jgi:HD-GYP domain-containing protein (c-di-GMP phosphodiesterase class II)
MSTRSLSLRARVAAVVGAVAVASALLMGFLGLRITRNSLEKVSLGAAKDVAVLLATQLDQAGLTPARLEIETAESPVVAAESLLRHALEQLNHDGEGLWTCAVIMTPEGDRWRILAEVQTSGHDRTVYARGDVIAIACDEPSAQPSVDRPTGGWLQGELQRWFAANAPIGGGTGVVSVGIHLEEASDYVQRVLLTVVAAMAMSLLFAMVLGWWGARVILRPIEEVRRFAARLGRRDYATRVREHGAPEMRRMLRDMNHLAVDLAQRDSRLLERMARIAETRDPRETGAHVKRVSGVSVEILDGWLARHPMGEDEARLSRDTLRAAAMLHDVGKVGISDVILKKPGKLDDAEYTAMKRHTILGAALLPGSDPYDDAAHAVALRHHERWDGRGYPGEVDLSGASGDIEGLLHIPVSGPGLAGEAIPLFARIVSIADVYDALRSPRAYKQAWPEERVLQTIRDDAGKAFDPELIEIFLERHDRIRAVWAAHPDAPHPSVTSPAPAPAP